MSFYKKYDFLRSQSALKDFEKEGTCPTRWKRTYLTKEIQRTRSIEMMYGLYFEQFILGEGAYSEGTVEWPGPKTSVYKDRIHRQVDRIKSILKTEFNLEEFESQVKIIDGVDKVIIDILGNNNSGTIMIDLKLTSDVSATHGPFPWGDPYSLDLTQQIYYERILEKNIGHKLTRNSLLIADYSADEKISIIDISVSDEAKEMVINRFNDHDNKIEEHEKLGWVLKPSYEECSKCMMKKCPVRISEKPIIRHSISIF